MVPFMNEKTLMGAKLELYILLKILKIITNTPATSFKIKYAVNTVFNNSVPDKLGEAALRILNFRTLKGET